MTTCVVIVSSYQPLILPALGIVSVRCPLWVARYFILLFPPLVPQVYTVDIQAEVLGLMRAILVTFMPRTALVRRSMQELLQIPDDVWQAFEKQLTATGSDSKQRAVIRQLVAQAGNDEVGLWRGSGRVVSGVSYACGGEGPTRGKLLEVVLKRMCGACRSSECCRRWRSCRHSLQANSRLSPCRSSALTKTVMAC